MECVVDRICRCPLLGDGVIEEVGGVPDGLQDGAGRQARGRAGLAHTRGIGGDLVDDVGPGEIVDLHAVDIRALARKVIEHQIGACASSRLRSSGGCRSASPGY